jgi:hypothetical protein
MTDVCSWENSEWKICYLGHWNWLLHTEGKSFRDEHTGDYRKLYRVIQVGRSILWEVIVLVIVRTKSLYEHVSNSD